MIQLSDTSIKTILITIVLTYIAALFVQLAGRRPYNIINWLNVSTAFVILIYWISKQFRITQHIYDFREIIFLCMEGLFAGMAIYSILTSTTNHFVNVMKYVIYGIHLAGILTLLLFMLTFKMNRLF